ncbi:unnamed protein product [Diatraea saccharalis]|uniref:Uncharacterized protein n=1 Tax=Diatraea saccharalis TaxID=40085 RepID=A0A9N9R669_9NEOP|nr:unnamed protein product [Diatraea saccharalis]
MRTDDEPERQVMGPPSITSSSSQRRPPKKKAATPKASVKDSGRHVGMSLFRRRQNNNSDDEYEVHRDPCFSSLPDLSLVVDTDLSITEINARAIEQIKRVKLVCAKSKNLKGTMIKEVNQATSNLENLINKTLTTTADDEIRRLRADNKRMKSELEHLSNELKAIKRDMAKKAVNPNPNTINIPKRGQKKAPQTIAQEITRENDMEVDDSSLRASVVDEIKNAVIETIAVYMNARFEGIEERLLLPQTRRPPLSSDTRNADSQLPSKPSQAGSSGNGSKQMGSTAPKKAVLTDGNKKGPMPRTGPSSTGQERVGPIKQQQQAPSNNKKGRGKGKRKTNKPAPPPTLAPLNASPKITDPPVRETEEVTEERSWSMVVKKGEQQQEGESSSQSQTGDDSQVFTKPANPNTAEVPPKEQRRRNSNTMRRSSSSSLEHTEGDTKEPRKRSPIGRVTRSTSRARMEAGTAANKEAESPARKHLSQLPRLEGGSTPSVNSLGRVIDPLHVSQGLMYNTSSIGSNAASLHSNEDKGSSSSITKETPVLLGKRVREEDSDSSAKSGDSQATLAKHSSKRQATDSDHRASASSLFVAPTKTPINLFGGRGLRYRLPGRTSSPGSSPC